MPVTCIHSGIGFVRWWREWRNYTTYTEGMDGERAGPPKKPSAIDNQDLLVSPASQHVGDADDLKPELAEGVDYALLPTPVWNTLLEW